MKDYDGVVLKPGDRVRHVITGVMFTIEEDSMGLFARYPGGYKGRGDLYNTQLVREPDEPREKPVITIRVDLPQGLRSSGMMPVDMIPGDDTEVSINQVPQYRARVVFTDEYSRKEEK